MKKEMKYRIKRAMASFLCSFLFVSCQNPWVIEILYRNEKLPLLYTVTFNADNGSVLSTWKVEAGSRIRKPSDPVKEGYDFDYWFNIATDKEWNFNTVVTADVTLKARWIYPVGPQVINIIFSDIYDALSSLWTNPITISRNGGGGYPSSLPLNLDTPGQYDAGSIKWYLNGELKSETGSFTFVSPDSLD